MSAEPFGPRPSTTPGVHPPRSVTTRAVLWLIGLYQAYSSRRPARCRYLPTCSQYAREAVERHGPARGGWLALRRVVRCNPLGSYGFDPVPERMQS